MSEQQQREAAALTFGGESKVTEASSSENAIEKQQESEAGAVQSSVETIENVDAGVVADTTPSIGSSQDTGAMLTFGGESKAAEGSSSENVIAEGREASAEAIATSVESIADAESNSAITKALGSSLLLSSGSDLQQLVLERLSGADSSETTQETATAMRELAVYTAASKVQSALLASDGVNATTSAADYQKLGFNEITDSNKGLADLVVFKALSSGNSDMDLASAIDTAVEQFDRLLALASPAAEANRITTLVNDDVSLQLGRVAEQWDALFGDSTYDDTLVEFLSEQLLDDDGRFMLASVDLTGTPGKLTAVELPSGLSMSELPTNALQIEGRDASGKWQALPQSSMSMGANGVVTLSQNGEYFTGFRVMLSDAVAAETRQLLVGETVVFVANSVDTSAFAMPLEGLGALSTLDPVMASQLISWSAPDDWTSFQALDHIVPVFKSLSEAYTAFYGGDPDAGVQQSILRLAVSLSSANDAVLLSSMSELTAADVQTLTGIDVVSASAVEAFVADLLEAQAEDSGIDGAIERLFMHAWRYGSEQLLLESFDELATRVVNLSNEDMNDPAFVREAERLGSVIRFKQLLDGIDGTEQAAVLESSDFEYFGVDMPSDLTRFADYLGANRTAILTGTQSMSESISAFETELLAAQVALDSLFGDSAWIEQEIDVLPDDGLERLMSLAANEYGDNETVFDDLVAAIAGVMAGRERTLARFDMTADAVEYFALVDEAGERQQTIDGVQLRGIASDGLTAVNLDFVPVLGQPGLWSFPADANNYEQIEVVASGYAPVSMDIATVQTYGRDHTLTPEYLSLLGYEGYTTSDIPMLYKMASVAEQHSDSPSAEDVLANYTRIKPLLALQNPALEDDAQLDALWQWANGAQSRVENASYEAVSEYPTITTLNNSDTHLDYFEGIFDPALYQRFELFDRSTGTSVWSLSDSLQVDAELELQAPLTNNSAVTPEQEDEHPAGTGQAIHNPNRDWSQLLDQLEQHDTFA